MLNKHKNQIKLSLIFIWCTISIIYFYKHFPIIHLSEVTLNLSALFIIILFLSALGRYILKYFHLEWNSFSEELCFSFTTGSGTFILLIIVLAYIKLFFEIVIISLFFILFILIYKEAKYFITEVYNEFSKFLSSKKTHEERVFISFTFIATLLTLLAALTPPFFYDALSYHLAVPHKYLANHGFCFLPLNYFSNFPANLGMLFALGLSLSGGLLAKLLSWMYAPLTALAVYSFSKSFWGKKIGIFSAAILIYTPGVMILSTLTSVDLAVTFYSFMSLYSILYWFKFSQKRWFIFSGIFCSIAIGTKYTAILVSFFTLEIILFIHSYFVKKKSFLNGIKHCIYFCFIVLLCFSPWLIKNLIYTNNPLYPFSYSIFKSNSIEMNDYSQVMRRIGNPIHRWFYSYKDNKSSLVEGIKIILTSPWRITMTTNGAAGKTGIIFLLGLPFLLFLKKIPLFIGYLLFFSATVFMVWIFFLPWMLRFAFPMFPALSIILAYTLVELLESYSFKKWITIGISIALTYNLFLFFSETISILRPFSYLFANQSKEEFLVSHGVNYFPVIEWANNMIPEDSRILFIGELRGYYCKRDYLQHVGIAAVDEEKLILRNLIKKFDNTEDIIRELNNLGITHILINFSEMSRIAKNYLSIDSYFDFQQKEKNELAREFFSHYLFPLASKYNVTLYEIKYPISKQKPQD
jgi:4-amino-4-deoxy-L-arabinose transferase-like glycosyltransferase